MPELYLAGVIPGIILASLFMLVITIACLFKPFWGGEKVDANWSKRISTLPDLLAPIGLFFVVVGSIYAGFATPTEAASIGVVTALVIAAMYWSLPVKMLIAAFEGTMRATGMVMIIILAAVFLNFVLGFMGVTQKLISGIDSLRWTPTQTILMIIVFYLFLAMFMETLSMMLTTVPIVVPIVVHMGYDPVWFGILITDLMEAALIAPCFTPLAKPECAA